ncbi:MAG: hypothetical protein CL867_08935 [Cytophagaceae bacterium]|nr:hypothetical protein [Cytophagaceae bacterium]
MRIDLSDETAFIDAILKNTIQGASFGDAPKPIQEGQGTANANPTPPKPNEIEEEEEKREMAQQVAQQLKRSRPNGDWFNSMFGRNAGDLVKDLRLARRVNKSMRGAIDEAIDAIRIAKKQEVEATLQSIEWIGKHDTTVRNLGISDRDLQALRKHGLSREYALRRACVQWEKANDTISKLLLVEGDFDDNQRQLWVDAQQVKKNAKKEWRNSLHSVDNIKKTDAIFLAKAANILEERGPLSSKEVFNSMQGTTHLTTQKLSALFKMHGVEYDIEKVGIGWGLVRDNSVIFKDVWAYAAGFLDADGYITITKRLEPRAGFIATGDRGKLHCEQLHKALGCGVLQTDLKIHKNSRRTQHRLQFYSENDLRKLMKGITQHLRMKKGQAGAVVELLDMRGRKTDIIKSRRDELYRIVKWLNWKDVPDKREELLKEWNIDEVGVRAMFSRDGETLRLLDDAGRLVEMM